MSGSLADSPEKRCYPPTPRMQQDMRYTVYADINCPFCFALNERSNAMDLVEEVAWRPIQHAADISSARYSFESLSELTAGVMEVGRRVPALNIVTPPFRPGTALASELITEAAVIDPHQASRLRTLIYQALWRFGQDISDPAITEKLVAEANLKGLVISDNTCQKLHAWQQEWQNGEFQRNIPVTLSSGGNSLIGLPMLAEQNRFFVASQGPGSRFVDGMFDGAGTEDSAARSEQGRHPLIHRTDGQLRHRGRENNGCAGRGRKQGRHCRPRGHGSCYIGQRLGKDLL